MEMHLFHVRGTRHSSLMMDPSKRRLRSTIEMRKAAEEYVLATATKTHKPTRARQHHPKMSIRPVRWAGQSMAGSILLMSKNMESCGMSLIRVDGVQGG